MFKDLIAPGSDALTDAEAILAEYNTEVSKLTRELLYIRTERHGECYLGVHVNLNGAIQRGVEMHAREVLAQHGAAEDAIRPAVEEAMRHTGLPDLEPVSKLLTVCKGKHPYPASIIYHDGTQRVMEFGRRGALLCYLSLATLEWLRRLDESVRNSVQFHP